MTIDDAIKALEAVKAKHGGTVEVFFDCPSCESSFTPGYVATAAVHVRNRQPAPAGSEPGGIVNSLKQAAHS